MAGSPWVETRRRYNSGKWKSSCLSALVRMERRVRVAFSEVVKAKTKGKIGIHSNLDVNFRYVSQR